MKYWGEDDFTLKNESLGAAFRAEHYEDGFFQGIKDRKIHYTFAHNPKEKAAVVISHGYCEFLGKFDEMIYYLYQSGFSVYFIDHLGHGFSQRLVEEVDKVHAEKFREYSDDLKLFTDIVVKKYSPGMTLLLLGHSMGGAIAATVTEDYPDLFTAAVFTSPMIKMNFGNLPKIAIPLMIVGSAIACKRKEYVAGRHGFDHKYVFEASSCQSRPRYDYVFGLREKVAEYSTYGGTYGWAVACIHGCRRLQRNVRKIKIPCLLLQAGLDTMVDNPAQDRFATKNPCIRLERFPKSKHEIYNSPEEERTRYYDMLIGFFNQQLQ